MATAATSASATTACRETKAVDTSMDWTGITQELADSTLDAQPLLHQVPLERLTQLEGRSILKLEFSLCVLGKSFSTA